MKNKVVDIALGASTGGASTAAKLAMEAAEKAKEYIKANIVRTEAIKEQNQERKQAVSSQHKVGFLEIVIGFVLVLFIACFLLFGSVEKPLVNSGKINPNGLIKPVPDTIDVFCEYGGYPGHRGTDYACPIGTEIYAAADGVVAYANNTDTWGDSWGYYVKIEHVKDDVYTLYAHCSEVLVKNGQSINQGDLIAKSGETGNVTGPHLHFELYLGGSNAQRNRVDPVPFVGTDRLKMYLYKVN